MHGTKEIIASDTKQNTTRRANNNRQTEFSKYLEQL
jgi:hypothetical protein